MTITRKDREDLKEELKWYREHLQEKSARVDCAQKEKAIEIARNALTAGIRSELVTKVCGLTLREIEEWRNPHQGELTTLEMEKEKCVIGEDIKKRGETERRRFALTLAMGGTPPGTVKRITGLTEKEVEGLGVLATSLDKEKRIQLTEENHARKERAIGIAVGLLIAETAPELVAKVTGLTPREISKLEKNIEEGMEKSMRDMAIEMIENDFGIEYGERFEV